MKRIFLIAIILSIIALSASCISPVEMRTVNNKVVTDCYGNILPCATNTYDLGSAVREWNNLYVNNIVGWTAPGSHAQNTDTILTYDGTNALISSGLVTYDIETDRWLHSLTNTFFGIGTAGAGNLSHTVGITGYENTAFGCDAGSSLLTGYSNTFVGNNAGEGNTSGYDNTAVGADALNNASIADSNVAVGDQAMMNCTGGKNTALGKGAMGGAGTGEYNTAVGLQTLNNTAGSQNTAIGVWAGTNNTGDGNVFVGYRAGENNGATSNVLYIDNSNTATPLIYGDFSTNTVTINNNLTVTTNVKILGVPIYANNAAALLGGLVVGNLYRTGGDPDLLCIVH